MNSKKEVLDPTNILNENLSQNIEKFSKEELQETFTYLVKKGMFDQIEKVISFARKQNIELDFKQSCQTGVDFWIKEGWFNDIEEAISFAKKQNIELDLSSPEIQRSCQGRVFTCMWYENDFGDSVEEAISFAKKYNIKLDWEKIKVTCRNRLDDDLREKVISFAKKHDLNLELPIFDKPNYEQPDMKKSKEQVEKKEGPFYYYEGLFNNEEGGGHYGYERHLVVGETKEEAIKNLTEYFQLKLEDGKTTLGYEWAEDIQGKTPKEAAEIKLSNDDGTGEDGVSWGDSSSVWAQERFGHDIGPKEDLEEK